MKTMKESDQEDLNFDIDDTDEDSKRIIPETSQSGLVLNSQKDKQTTPNDRAKVSNMNDKAQGSNKNKKEIYHSSNESRFFFLVHLEKLSYRWR